ncbi:class I SAM-dependent methyltransferase [Solitalea canadensis]|uniref:Methyltransferase family protein n=1 Tax=Solitalea canadensis (strain ATCC 29591 / DSM 3403 / JCM 21819 / LMG 8368 / NBRC 15130 / NCIMB 12057 / USAM 9D) TaxID=929556 RepID=H8KN32_SOLCM|nr:hypothetical protein [Solitalea canadensis]AFD09111.1 hypothetical protein Solca_4121 [Solitalea canadensis DSM 3403]
MHLLFPGRHHLLTDFQFKYLNQLIQTELLNVSDVEGNSLQQSKVESVIFAVTSANHSNTRRNPLPFYLRALAIEDFARDLNVPVYIFGIDDVGKLEDFASYTIKKIKHESDGLLNLNATNCAVICSTPVMQMYQQHGFRILPAELNVQSNSFDAEQPWDLVEHIAKTPEWSADGFTLNKVHTSSYKIWKRYQLGSKVQLLFNDHIIGEDGDLTATRDYNSYVRQMDEIAEMKYHDTSEYIRQGRIGDIGCAVGSWIKLASKDERFRESDFFGIEVSRHLFDICQQRKHNGEFANPYVFFAQKNAVTGLVFEENSMNCIFTSSLTHEIESYGGRQDLLNFISNRFSELAPSGVWVNRDVVGPENGDKIVYLKLNKQDGVNENSDGDFATRNELTVYLDGLSTYGRFLRFAVDFRKKEGYKLEYKEEIINDESYIKLSLSDACEFMSRKDYTDNWESEMHETFTFWSFEDWKSHLEEVGFTVMPTSSAYTNDWIVQNRLIGKCELFEMGGDTLKPMNYPVTNMLMIAEKKI